MPLDSFKNFAYSLVATAPAPADTGTSLVVTAGQGTRFPAAPFNATIWPVDVIPTPANAEIVRVTAVVVDTLTITRAQEGTTARSVVVGDQIAAAVTALTLSTLESDISIVSAAVTSVEVHASAASAAATSADTHATTASAAATSADAHANAVSAALATLSLNVSAISTALSNELSVRAASVQTASAAATSADAHANAVSAALATLSLNVSAISTNVSTLSAAGATLSLNVSAISTKLSNELSVRSAADAALSVRIDAIPGGASAAAARKLSTIQTISATVLTNVSGLSVSVSAGGFYRIDGMLGLLRGAAAQPYGYGLTFPAATDSRGIIRVTLSTLQGLGSLSTREQVAPWDGAASGSIIVSTVSTTTLTAQACYQGYLFASATGVVQLQAKASAGAAALQVVQGSYLRVYKL